MAATSGSSESRIQAFVHSIEQGGGASIIRIAVIVVAILAMSIYFLGWKFRGFALPEAMDQAQVAREVSRGHGWTTKLIRPLAIWQIESHQKTAPQGNFPDTFNAPLPPLVNALAIKMAGNKMEFKPGEYIAPSERFIVALSMLCFVLAVLIEYFLLRRLFDNRLAFWAAVLTLATDVCWQFTLSGLPHMLMLLLLNAALYTLVRAIEAHLALERGPTVRQGPEGEEIIENEPSVVPVLTWLAATGGLLGLLTLSHGVAVWVFVGALAFSAVFFRRRALAVLVLLVAFALICTPWIVRNYQITGSPFGLAGYAVFDGLGNVTIDRMRSTTGPLTDNIQLQFFRTKIQDGIAGQMSHLSTTLGGNVIAFAFFLCMLHTFRRPEVNALRIAVLSMWGGGVLGMALLGGVPDPATPVGPNQIGVIFLPIMLGFGLAYVLVLFSRREEGVGPIARFMLFAVLFLVSATPLLFTLIPRNLPPAQYPPYFQPGLNRMSNWTSDSEIIGADMPWAVAWYADRKSLWIPNKFQDFMGLSDNGKLSGPLAGLLLTQISRNQPLYAGILRGQYSEYQTLIFGKSDIPFFPFHEGFLMIGDPSGYVFYSDRRRWDKPAAPTQP